eukprot:TRINITY_DN10835_c0_g1_i2.p1 TRINITY_DN10835_c0_g1~~TRINITY_DN10835_c0_g1_i2.p1  ORF type:complete len:518 (-),score=101.22 TRINITY_DN10835_c0_g1_i2:152-1705(-)
MVPKSADDGTGRGRNPSGRGRFATGVSGKEAKSGSPARPHANCGPAGTGGRCCCGEDDGDEGGGGGDDDEDLMSMYSSLLSSPLRRFAPFSGTPALPLPLSAPELPPLMTSASASSVAASTHFLGSGAWQTVKPQSVPIGSVAPRSPPIPSASKPKRCPVVIVLPPSSPTTSPSPERLSGRRRSRNPSSLSSSSVCVEATTGALKLCVMDDLNNDNSDGGPCAKCPRRGDCPQAMRENAGNFSVDHSSTYCGLVSASSADVSHSSSPSIPTGIASGARMYGQYPLIPPPLYFPSPSAQYPLEHMFSHMNASDRTAAYVADPFFRPAAVGIHGPFVHPPPHPFVVSAPPVVVAKALDSVPEHCLTCPDATVVAVSGARDVEDLMRSGSVSNQEDSPMAHSARTTSRRSSGGDSDTPMLGGGGGSKRKKERSAQLGDLIYHGRLEEAGKPFHCIRIWRKPDDINCSAAYYDCECEKRKAIRNLSKIKLHVKTHQMLKCESCGEEFISFEAVSSISSAGF